MPKLDNPTTSSPPKCIFANRQTANTSGGTATSGSFNTVPLTTEVLDTHNIASLASNTITIAAGVYDVYAVIPAFRVDNFATRIFDVTGNAVLLTGGSAYSNSSNNFAQAISILSGRITLTVESQIRVQLQPVTTAATNGMGVASGLQTEEFATITLVAVQ